MTICSSGGAAAAIFSAAGFFASGADVFSAAGFGAVLAATGLEGAFEGAGVDAAFALAFDAGFAAGVSLSTGGSFGPVVARALPALDGTAPAGFGLLFFGAAVFEPADLVAIESTPCCRLAQTLPEPTPAFYSLDHRILPWRKTTEAPASLTPMGKRDIPVGRLGLVVIAAAGVAACVSRAGLESSAAPVDPNSRIGQAVIEAMRNPGPYPKFSDIPKVPADMAEPRPFAEVIAPLVAQRAAIGAEVASLPAASPPPNEREAARLRALLAIEPPPADATARAEAYARSLRDRAKPPPAPR